MSTHTTPHQVRLTYNASLQELLRLSELTRDCPDAGVLEARLRALPLTQAETMLAAAITVHACMPVIIEGLSAWLTGEGRECTGIVRIPR